MQTKYRLKQDELAEKTVENLLWTRATFEKEI